MKKQMIKRADGSYSQRGLWDNIRANRGSGKKPTAQMLKQERKIKANMADGGVNNPGFKALPGYVQAKIRANMQEGGMTGSPIVDIINNQSQMPMMQMGGTMPQTSAGQSVLQEAMAMSKMQDGGKMPNSIARARFMAAANGNVSKAKETASKYGYKMQSGGMNLLGVPNMNSGTAGFDFAKASAYANAPKEEVPTDIERMQGIEIKKKRSFFDKVKGNVRKAGRAVGLGSPVPKTDSQQVMDEVVGQVRAEEQARMKSNAPTSAERSRTAFNKIKSGDVSMKNIGDYMEGFGTYLNASSDRNVVTDLFDITATGAAAVGAGNLASNISQGKQASQAVMQSGLGKAVDLVNPLSIGANLVSGVADAAGELSEGNYTEAAGVAGNTAALAALRGKAGNVSKNAIGRTATAIGKTKVGSAASNAISSATRQGVGHQLQHAGQHMLLSPLLAHKKGGSIKSMYSKKYMALGAKAVDTYAADGNDPKFEQYYNQQIQKLNQSGVTKADLPTRNAVYDYYKSSSPTSVTDQTGRMMFNSPSAKPLLKSNTYTEAVDPNTGQVAMQPTNLNKEIFNQDVKKFGYGGKAGLKDMYYMKKGGQFPDRYKKMGFSGVDKPKRTTSGGKSHAVVTKVDGNYKLIRFGQAGEVGSPDGTARNKAFKARHAKNIAKGKSSAAYWANKVKW